MRSIFDYKAYLLDMDGTLIDSMSEWYKTGSRVIKEIYNEDVEFDDNEIHKKIWSRIDKETPSRQKEIMAIWNSYMEEAYKHVVIKEGVIEFLNKAKELGITLVVATGTPLFLAIPVLKRLKLDTYFTIIQDIYYVHSRKSSGLLYKKLAEELSLDPSECLVFEDVPKNLVEPLNMGFNTVGVYDYIERNRQKELESVSTYYAYDFQELLIKYK